MNTYTTKLAACIKIRNKEVAFTSYINSSNANPGMAKVSNILSRINPTSFRNSGMATLKGLGIQGAAVGGAQFIPGVSEATAKVIAGGAANDAFRTGLTANIWGSVGRGVGTGIFTAKNELLRQQAIRDAIKKGLITTEQLADNVTRYVPLKNHASYLNTLEQELGKDVMKKYRGAFVL
jgi:hypothetical protein